MVQINDKILVGKKEPVSSVLIENKYEEDGIWNLGRNYELEDGDELVFENHGRTIIDGSTYEVSDDDSLLKEVGGTRRFDISCLPCHVDNESDRTEDRYAAIG